MRVFYIKFFLFLFLTICVGKICNAATYYVAAPLTSNDTASGTSSDPFHSFWRPMFFMRPGDTLHIASGKYSSLLYINVSGTASAPITITGDAFNMPQIETAAGNAVQLKKGVSYIKIGYLDIKADAAEGSGIFTEGYSKNIAVYGNKIHDCGAAGIGAVQDDYLSITGNIIYNNGWRSRQDPSGIDLYELFNSDTDTTHFHNYIGGNLVYGNANHVPDAYSGKITDGNGIIIDDNRHTQNAVQGGSYLGATLIENNVVYGNGGRGIHVYASDNIMIRNNTSYQNNLSPYSKGFFTGEVEAMRSGNITIINNVLWAQGSGYTAFQAQDSTGLNVDYNMSYNADTPYVLRSTGTSWGKHSLSANPGLINPSLNPASANFQLLSWSPAVGRGAPGAGASSDFAGRSRPQQAALGAYQ